MRKDSNTLNAFFELLRAGLWGRKKTEIQIDETIDWERAYRLAEEQSVIGLIAAGLDSLPLANRPSQKVLLQFVGSALQIEQRNMAMNEFVAKLISKLRENNVYTLLVKGQGIAQCYEHPLWRSCGDVDLLLNNDDYNAAKNLLMPLANSMEEEDAKRLHLGLNIDSWVVELHGTLYTRQLKRVNRVVDEAQRSVFYEGKVRSWVNGKTQVFLPAPDEDVVFVFSHIIQHFFGGGIGLRQVCDWCRLIWTYKDVLDLHLLEARIRRMGMMTEWKALAAMAVEYLGMPVEAMPLYDSSNRWKRKAKKIVNFILETGNFGHNRDQSFRRKSALANKFGSLMRYTSDTIHHASIFPKDSLMVWCRMVARGLKGE